MGSHDPPQDDNLEIEVSSLQPAATASETAAQPASARPLFARSQSRRTLWRRGALVTGVLVALLVALTLSIAPTRNALRGAVFGPTPTATVPVGAGEDDLYVSISPHWGAVTVDGKPLAHLPVEGVDQPLHLARGVHTLRWRFAPIIDTTCHLTVPTKLGDNCPLRVGIQPGKKGIATVVALQLSFETVAPAYRGSLLAAIQAALDTKQSSDLVRPGELYVGQYDPTSQRSVPLVATQPLRATLNFVSDVENPNAHCPAISSGPGAGCEMNGSDCREICIAPWQTPPTAQGVAWQAYIVAHAFWHITTLDGHPIEQDPPDVGGISNLLGSIEFPVPIAISWDGSTWHVDAMVGVRDQSSPLPDLVCASAWADVQNSFVAPPDPGGWQVVTVAYISDVPAASGCLLVMTVAGRPPMFVLHRFGVALAANSAAQHSLEPSLPMADAYEQAIAQQLARQLPGIAGAG